MLNKQKQKQQEEARLLDTLQKRLIALCSDAQVRRVIAGNSVASADLLRQLTSDRDSQVRQAVADNPATPAGLLQQLAGDQDKQVRQAVAGNPNTPWESLQELAWEFPQTFLHNPLVALQFLTRPEQISTYEVFWGMLLREGSLPSIWWSWLRGHPKLSQSLEVRVHVQLAGETSHFAGDPQETARDVLPILASLLTTALKQEIPLPIFGAIDQSALTDAQRIAAHLQWFARSASAPIRRIVAAHPQASEELLRVLAQDQDSRVCRSVAKNKHAPEDVVRMFPRDGDSSGHSVTARDERAQQKMLQAQARDEDYRVRGTVAKDKRTSEEILRILAQDEHSWVRKTVAENKHAPEDVLRTLARDRDSHVRIAVAENKRVPEDVLRALARDQSFWVRWTVAENVHAPDDVLLALAQDNHFWVRKMVARNERASEEVLLTLAQHYPYWEEGNRLLARQVRRRHLSETFLRILAHHPSRKVRYAVVSNTWTPEDIWRVQVRDPDRGMRRAVARREQLPTEFWQMLLQDRDLRVRLILAEHKDAPAHALRALGQDQSKWVRRAVALNEGTPENLLRTLTQDPEQEVQSRASFALRLLNEGASRGLQYEDEQWKKERRHFLQDVSGNYGFASLIPIVQVKQLERIANLNISENTRQAMFAVLAVSWNDTLIDVVCRNAPQLLITKWIPSFALQKCALSFSWQVRYLMALHPRTPWAARENLCQDGNRYVRAMARAVQEQLSTSTGAREEDDLRRLRPDVLALPTTQTSNDRSEQTQFDASRRKAHPQEALYPDLLPPDPIPINAARIVSTLLDDSHGSTSQQATLPREQASVSRLSDPLRDV